MINLINLTLGSFELISYNSVTFISAIECSSIINLVKKSLWSKLNETLILPLIESSIIGSLKKILLSKNVSY